VQPRAKARSAMLRIDGNKGEKITHLWAFEKIAEIKERDAKLFEDARDTS
jgi:hypothetical protein